MRGIGKGSEVCVGGGKPHGSPDGEASKAREAVSQQLLPDLRQVPIRSYQHLGPVLPPVLCIVNTWHGSTWVFHVYVERTAVFNARFAL